MLWSGAPEEAEVSFAAAGLPRPLENENASYRLEITEHMLEVASCPEKCAMLFAALNPDSGGGGDGGGTSSSSSSSVGGTRDTVVNVQVVSAPPAEEEDVEEAINTASASAASEADKRRRAQRLRWRSKLTEIRVLMRRSAVTILRDPNLLVAHFAIAASTALILGCLYLDSPRTLAGFQNRAGGREGTSPLFSH